MTVSSPADDEEITDCPQCAVNGYLHRPGCRVEPYARSVATTARAYGEELRQRIEALIAQHQPTPGEDHFAGRRFPRDMCSCGDSFYDDCETRELLRGVLDAGQ